MDTQPKDVPLLLPVLLSYDVELSMLQYPSHYLLGAFRSFLRHAKIVDSVDFVLWRDLYLAFSGRLQRAWEGESLPVSLPSRPTARGWVPDCRHTGAA
jgi:hypothetical protein